MAKALQQSLQVLTTKVDQAPQLDLKVSMTKEGLLLASHQRIQRPLVPAPYNACRRRSVSAGLLIAENMGPVRMRTYLKVLAGFHLHQQAHCQP